MVRHYQPAMTLLYTTSVAVMDPEDQFCLARSHSLIEASRVLPEGVCHVLLVFDVAIESISSPDSCIKPLLLSPPTIKAKPATVAISHD